MHTQVARCVSRNEAKSSGPTYPLKSGRKNDHFQTLAESRVLSGANTESDVALKSPVLSVVRQISLVQRGRLQKTSVLSGLNSKIAKSLALSVAIGAIYTGWI